MWEEVKYDENGVTKWGWKVNCPESLVCGNKVDIGAFTYINARYGVEIGEEVQIGSHCSIYSHSTIDDKKGKVTIKDGACIGTHSTIMPGITIGEGALIGAYSFVNKNVNKGEIVWGIPAKTR